MSEIENNAIDKTLAAFQEYEFECLSRMGLSRGAIVKSKPRKSWFDPIYFLITGRMRNHFTAEAWQIEYREYDGSIIIRGGGAVEGIYVGKFVLVKQGTVKSMHRPDR